MTVDTAVAEQSNEVQGLALDGGLPCSSAPYASAADGFADELTALIEYPAGTHGIVADLGIAHVPIRGQPNSCAMGFEQAPCTCIHHPVQMRHLCEVDSIAFVSSAPANAV